jgi:hypothetical protein
MAGKNIRTGTTAVATQRLFIKNRGHQKFMDGVDRTLQ